MRLTLLLAVTFLSMITVPAHAVETVTSCSNGFCQRVEREKLPAIPVSLNVVDEITGEAVNSFYCRLEVSYGDKYMMTDQGKVDFYDEVILPDRPPHESPISLGMLEPADYRLCVYGLKKKREEDGRSAYLFFTIGKKEKSKDLEVSISKNNGMEVKGRLKPVNGSLPDKKFSIFLKPAKTRQSLFFKLKENEKYSYSSEYTFPDAEGNFVFPNVLPGVYALLYNTPLLKEATDGVRFLYISENQPMKEIIIPVVICGDLKVKVTGIDKNIRKQLTAVLYSKEDLNGTDRYKDICTQGDKRPRIYVYPQFITGIDCGFSHASLEKRDEFKFHHVPEGTREILFCIDYPHQEDYIGKPVQDIYESLNIIHRKNVTIKPGETVKVEIDLSGITFTN